MPAPIESVPMYTFQDKPEPQPKLETDSSPKQSSGGSHTSASEDEAAKPTFISHAMQGRGRPRKGKPIESATAAAGKPKKLKTAHAKDARSSAAASSNVDANHKEIATVASSSATSTGKPQESAIAASEKLEAKPAKNNAVAKKPAGANNITEVEQVAAKQTVVAKRPAAARSINDEVQDFACDVGLEGLPVGEPPSKKRIAAQ